MRDELLADRLTENRQYTTTNHGYPVVARTATLHPPQPASLSIARPTTRGVTSTYRRIPRLPVRTLFFILLGAYVLLTAAVVLGSPLDALDRAAALSNFAHRYPNAAHWLLRYVIVGQRGPSSHVAFVYLAYRALRQRSWRPLVLLVTALTMLNLTIGSVKLATGRLGPALTTRPHAVFDGGDIFPSGHTANAVVIFGVLAMVAVEYRRAMIALAVFVSITVGLSAIFLETHWVTDVLGGWIGGALVLLALPATYAFIERCARHTALALKGWVRPAMRSDQRRWAVPLNWRSTTGPSS